MTITGSFVGITSVYFNAVASTFTLVSETQLRTKVPAGATTGLISVTNSAGSTTSASNFTIAQVPVISSFTPTTGWIGTVVTINGNNFIGTTGVTFSGWTGSSFTVVNNTQILAPVPSAAHTGPILVRTPAGTDTSSSNFTIAPLPVIFSFTPTSGTVGTVVTINGNNFTGTTAVKFNGTNASPFTVVNNTQIRANVPSGATSGPISVTNPAGTTTSASNFTISSGGAPSTITLQPTDDAYVWENNVTSNYGSGTELRARTSSGGIQQFTFSKFNVTGISGSVVSAKVRLFVLDNSNQGGSIFSVSNSLRNSAVAWVENNIVFNNAPVIGGSALSSLGPISMGTTVEFDVTAAITGNGIFSFGIQSTSSDAAKYHSKENANAPELVIETNGGGTPDPPMISSFDPATGVVGTQVTITGNNFIGATSVSFNATSVSTFFTDSNTQIRANVPSGATAGPISITNAAGTGSSSGDFTVTLAPVISSFTPTIGSEGTVVTISGSNFSGASAVQFNGAPASFTVISNSEVSTAVPPGATTGKIGVTNANGSTLSANEFAILIGTGLVAHEETKTGASTEISSVSTSSDLTAVSGDLYLAAITVKGNSAVVNNVSGLGLTWSLVRAQCAGRGQTRVEVWRAQGTPSGNGNVTATLASAPRNAVIAVSRYSGVATVNPIGNIVSGNTRGVNATCSGGSDNISYSFNITAVASAAVYGAVGMRNRTHTPGAGYTERVDLVQGDQGAAAGLAIEEKIVGTAGNTILNGSLRAAVDWAVVGLEIRPMASLAKQSGTEESKETVASLLPEQFELYQNYPNPFNAETQIEFALPVDAKVKLGIFNLRGQLVRMLFDGEQKAGIVRLRWDSKNSAAMDVGSGVYILRLEVGEKKLSRKITLLK